MAEYIRQILPPSIGHDAKVQAMAQGVDEQLHAAHELVPPLAMYPDLSALATSPERFTPDQIEHFGKHFAIPCWELLDDEQRRSLVRDFFELHRYRGTAYAFRFLCERVLRTKLLGYAPPTRRFFSKSMTAEQQARWEAPHPEVRFYPFRQRDVRPAAKMFFGQPLSQGRNFLAFSTALLRAGNKITLYDPQTEQETELQRYQPVVSQEQGLRREEVQIQLRAPRPAAKMFFGQPLALGRSSLIASADPARRVYTVDMVRPYQTEVERRQPMSLKPGLQPMHAYYEVRFLSTDAGQRRNFFQSKRARKNGKCYFGRFFLNPTSAHMRIYRVIKLFDPERVQLESRKSTFFFGHSRCGEKPAHEAELRVLLLADAPARKFFFGKPLGGKRHFLTESRAQARIEHACAVLRTGKRASDKVLIQHANYKKITASPTLMCGDATCGQYHLEG